MNLKFKRDKLNMQTITKIQAMPGEPSDDGKSLKFPILVPVGEKNAPLADLNVSFELKNGELLGSVSVTYYDSPDATAKSYPLSQFKVNPDQLLQNAGVAKTNDDELVLSAPTAKQKKQTSIPGE